MLAMYNENTLIVETLAPDTLHFTNEPILDLVETASEAGRGALIHELQRQQKELETQREELKRVRQEAEQALRHYEELYHTTPVGYLTLDQKGMIRAVNGAGLQLFGAEQKSLLGKPIRLWVEKDSQDNFNQLYEYVSSTGQRKVCELKLLRKDGSFFHAALECRALPDIEESATCFLIFVNDITERIAAEIKLREIQTALKVLLKQREEDRMEMEKNVLSNIRKLVMPYLEKFKQTHLREDQAQYIQLIQTNIENVISPFLQSLSVRYDGFTPREIEIANMVKDGRTTKDIASLLYISTRSVEFNKDNIRRKMGLINKKINLQSYLISLERAPHEQVFNC